jgi:hypothetical protein
MKHGFPSLVFVGGYNEIMRKHTEPPYDLYWSQRTGFAKLAIENNAIIIPVAFVGNAENIIHFSDIPLGWLYGNHNPISVTNRLSIEEKYQVECNLINIRFKQLVDHNLLSIERATEWKIHHLQQLTDNKNVQLQTIPDQNYSGSNLLLHPNTSTDHQITLPLAFPNLNPFNLQRLYFNFGTPIDTIEYNMESNNELMVRHLRDRVLTSLETVISDTRKYQQTDPNRYTLSRFGTYLKLKLFG